MANEARDNVAGDFTKYLREQLRDPALAVEYIKASCENDLSLSETEFNKSIEMALSDIANAHESAIRTAAAALVEKIEGEPSHAGRIARTFYAEEFAALKAALETPTGKETE